MERSPNIMSSQRQTQHNNKHHFSYSSMLIVLTRWLDRVLTIYLYHFCFFHTYFAFTLFTSPWVHGLRFILVRTLFKKASYVFRRFMTYQYSYRTAKVQFGTTKIWTWDASHDDIFGPSLYAPDLRSDLKFINLPLPNS